MRIRIVPAVVLAAGLVAGGGAVLAQSTPTPSPSPWPTPSPRPSPTSINLPSTDTVKQIINQAIGTLQGNLQQAILNHQNDVTGTVTYFRRFSLQIQTGSSNYRQVNLHQGTTINPTGTTLRNGMRVRVRGESQPDGSLNANEIDLIQ